MIAGLMVIALLTLIAVPLLGVWAAVELAYERGRETKTSGSNEKGAGYVG